MTAARFLSLLLAFFLGFLSCIGAIFGVGYYAYSRVSLDKLEQWGVVSVDEDQYFEEDAEVDLTAMTIKSFISEIKRLQTLNEPITLSKLQEEWGLKLPDEVKKVIPDGVWNVPVAEIFSASGLTKILENTDVSYLFQFIELSDSMRETLEGKSLSDLTDYKELLASVRLGDLMGYTAEKDGEGNTVWKDGSGNALDKVTEAIAKMTISEITDGSFGIDRLLAGLYVGDLLKYQTVDDGAGNTVWKDANGNDLDKVTEALAKQSATELIGGSFSVDTMLSGLYVGDLLKYTAVKDDPDDPELVTGWYKETAGDLDKVTQSLAKQKLTDLTSGTFEVGNVLTGLYVGDMLKYTAIHEVPTDENSKIVGWMDGDKTVTGIDRATANIDLGKLINKTDGYKVSDAFDDVYIGEAMSYQKGDVIPNEDPYDLTVRYKWFKKDPVTEEYTVATTPIEEKLSNYFLGDLMNGRVTSKDLTDGPLHELLNLHAVETLLFDANGDPLLYTTGDHIGEQATIMLWYDENNVLQSHTISALADCTIDGISGQVNGVKVGRVTGHVLFEEAWYKAEFRNFGEGDDRYCLTEPKGVLASLANLTIGDLSNNAAVTEQIKTIKVGDAMGYTNEGGVWYSTYIAPADPGNVPVGPGVILSIADFKIGELETKIGDVKIGEVLGYTYYDVDGEWYTDTAHTNPVAGIMKPFVGLTINEMKNSENVTNAVKELKIGDAMGYSEEAGVWYKDNGHTDPVTGMMKALAGKTVGQMDGISAPGPNGIPVGELLGYEKHNDAWYEAGMYNELDPDSNQVTGVIGAICDSYVDNLSNDIKNMKLGKTLSLYQYENPLDPTDPNNGKWYKDKACTEPATGVMASFADLRIDDLQDEALVSAKSRNVVIGYAMGYTYADGVWYVTYVAPGDPGNVPVTGLMKTLAPKKVDELNDITDTKVGDAMGYTKVGDDWYSTYSDDGNPLNDVKASGVIQAVADSTIANLESDLNSSKVGKILGYTYNDLESWWYDGLTKTSTIINTISDTQLDQLGTRLSNLTVADMFSDTERASGFLSLLPADARLDELGGSGPNSMSSIFQNTTMGDYVTKGLINFSPSTQAKLTIVDPSWQTRTIQQFIDHLIDSFPMP